MKPRLPGKRDVIALLERENRAMHVQELVTALDVAPSLRIGFERMLDDIAHEGVIASRGGQRFGIAKNKGDWRSRSREEDFTPGYSTEKGEKNGTSDKPKKGIPVREESPQKEARSSRRGILSVNARGFGFVSAVEHPGEDAFIPEESIGGAMHGDIVDIDIVSRSSRGYEGVITKIVTRGVKRVAGILHRKGQTAWVEPDDTRLRGPIQLTSEIDTKGDEGNSGSDGDAVIVRLTRWPEFKGENAVGTLEAVLGRPGDLSVETQKILLMANIEEMHSPESVAEAEAYGVEVPKEMLEGRVDLTHIPLPTIDPEDARDHDDAVWVERTADGGYRAVIAIADVSSYVRPGTHLDEESQKRGCSTYLPTRAIPMLPRALSSNLCSLLPDVIRLCLAVDAKLDAGGRVEKYEIVRGFMKSQAKLNYGGVARALRLTDLPPKQEKAEEMVEGLRTALELSRLLRTKREKRGSLDFTLPEPKIIMNEQGEPTDVQKRAQDPGVKKAYELIEELMLLANELVAEFMVKHEVPAIYRVHLPPDEQKLERLTKMCAVLGVEFDVAATKDPKTLQALLKTFALHPHASVLNSLLLRSMKQATYEPQNLGHFGLASKAYLHFTSPIRRYPDLVVHRAVHRYLLKEKIDRSQEAKEKLAQAALDASHAERRSMEAERSVADLYRAFVMKDRLGERFPGISTAIVGSGIFATLESPFVDVLVRLADLGGSDFQVDDDGLRVTATRSGDTIALGDPMLVEITEVSLLRRTIYAKRIGGGGAIARGGGNDRPRGGRDPKGSKHDKRRDERKIKDAKRAIKKKTRGSSAATPRGKSKKRR